MPEFLTAAAAVVLAAVAAGLPRLLRRGDLGDKLLSVQLVGSGGIAALLLLAAADGAPAVVDVALELAVLAAFASVAVALSRR